jgi:hypothetical protein
MCRRSAQSSGQWVGQRTALEVLSRGNWPPNHTTGSRRTQSNDYHCNKRRKRLYSASVKLICARKAVKAFVKLSRKLQSRPVEDDDQKGVYGLAKYTISPVRDNHCPVHVFSKSVPQNPTAVGRVSKLKASSPGCLLSRVRGAGSVWRVSSPSSNL